MRAIAAIGFVVAIGMLASPSPALAHHAFSAEFDSNLPVTLKGHGDQDGMGQSSRVDTRRRGEG